MYHSFLTSQQWEIRNITLSWRRINSTNRGHVIRTITQLIYDPVLLDPKTHPLTQAPFWPSIKQLKACKVLLEMDKEGVLMNHAGCLVSSWKAPHEVFLATISNDRCANREKLLEHGIVFFQPQFTTKQDFGLRQNKRLKMGFLGSSFTERWIGEESWSKSQHWKMSLVQNHPQAQLGLRWKTSARALSSSASGPYETFPCQYISLGEELLHL